MAGLFAAFLLFLAIPTDAQQGPTATEQGEHDAGTTAKGITARASAARYTVHAQLQGVEVGATQLTSDEVRKIFDTDLNSCCLVFEVAVYPAKGETSEITRKDFTYRVVGTDITIKPSSPQILALSLQLVSRARTDLTPHGSVGVVYNSGGYDPVTGQMRGRGIGTSADVNVGASQPGAHSTEGDREFMEAELTDKSLPEGRVSSPIAGYVYFYLTKKAKKKKAPRQLEFASAGQKVVLALP